MQNPHKFHKKKSRTAKVMFTFYLLIFSQLGAFSAQASSINCAQLWVQLGKQEFRVLEPENDVTNNREGVRFVWFPTRAHIEVGIDNDAMDFFNVHELRKDAVRVMLHPRYKGDAIMFKLRVPEEKVAEAKSKMQALDRLPSHVTCVVGSCRFVGEQTGFWVPFPFNRSPVLAAGYLKLNYLLARGKGRVSKIEYVGKTKDLSFPENLLTEGYVHAGEVPVNVGLGAGAVGAGYLAFQVFYADGTEETLNVPVDPNRKFGDPILLDDQN